MTPAVMRTAPPGGLVLSSLSGLVGLGLAFLACVGLSALLKLPFVWEPEINVVAFAISALFGAIFG